VSRCCTGDFNQLEGLAVAIPWGFELYGKGRWRKMKGVARIRLRSGRVRLAERHWYEGHGIGEKELKRKRYLD
jgi:hypothetical protein